LSGEKKDAPNGANKGLRMWRNPILGKKTCVTSRKKPDKKEGGEWDTEKNLFSTCRWRKHRIRPRWEDEIKKSGLKTRHSMEIRLKIYHRVQEKEKGNHRSDASQGKEVAETEKERHSALDSKICEEGRDYGKGGKRLCSLPTKKGFFYHKKRGRMNQGVPVEGKLRKRTRKFIWWVGNLFGRKGISTHNKLRVEPDSSNEKRTRNIRRVLSKEKPDIRRESGRGMCKTSRRKHIIGL